MTIPPSADGREFYTIPEVLAILSPYDDNTRLTNRALAIKLLTKGGKVRGGKSIIYRHLNNSKGGLDLNNVELKLSPGRPLILEYDSVQLINRKMKEYDGNTYDHDDV